MKAEQLSLLLPQDRPADAHRTAPAALDVPVVQDESGERVAVPVASDTDRSYTSLEAYIAGR